MVAETLEDLSERREFWGVPPNVALATLHEYNEAVRSDTSARTSPPRRRNATQLARPPFTAVLVKAAITFTCGGLQADLDMNVLRRASTSSTMSFVTAQPSELQFFGIPNLYAAGCDLGGFSTRDYMGGLATALVTGRIAGKSASQNAKRRKVL
jgi:hypothetical protein